MSIESNLAELLASARQVAAIGDVIRDLVALRDDLDVDLPVAPNEPFIKGKRHSWVVMSQLIDSYRAQLKTEVEHARSIAARLDVAPPKVGRR